jgi:hypothetical protein
VEIIGSEIRQKELIALRKGLFAKILPPMERQEKRLWAANLVTFESHYEAVLALLSVPVNVAAVLQVVLSLRNVREQFPVRVHAVSAGPWGTPLKQSKLIYL